MSLITVTLCNTKDDWGVHVFIKAEIIEGCLKVSGHDIGKACENVCGDSDYEYLYSFDKENTQRLNRLLQNGTEQASMEKLLINNFSGLSGTARLRQICEDNGITFSFFSY